MVKTTERKNERKNERKIKWKERKIEKEENKNLMPIIGLSSGCQSLVCCCCCKVFSMRLGDVWSFQTELPGFEEESARDNTNIFF